jgi:hypothetical protein
MEVDQTKRYGVKVTILSTLDYNDFKEILDAIKDKGYDITLIDNGNAVCEKIQNEFKS